MVSKKIVGLRLSPVAFFAIRLLVVAVVSSEEAARGAIRPCQRRPEKEVRNNFGSLVRRMQSGAESSTEGARVHRSTIGRVRPRHGTSGPAPAACWGRHIGAHGLLVGWDEKGTLKAQFSVPQCP